MTRTQTPGTHRRTGARRASAIDDSALPGGVYRRAHIILPESAPPGCIAERKQPMQAERWGDSLSAMEAETQRQDVWMYDTLRGTKGCAYVAACECTCVCVGTGVWQCSLSGDVELTLARSSRIAERGSVFVAVLPYVRHVVPRGVVDGLLPLLVDRLAPRRVVCRHIRSVVVL